MSVTLKTAPANLIGQLNKTAKCSTILVHTKYMLHLTSVSIIWQFLVHSPDTYNFS